MLKDRIIESLKHFWENVCVVFKKKFFIRCLGFVFFLFFCFMCFVMAEHTYYTYRERVEDERMNNYPFEVMKHEAVLCYEENKSELVREVKSYIDSVAPTSNLTGYAIVEMCEKYDLDIKFVLAQGHIESHFGTTGMAQKTNSVFNVGAFDNHTYTMINGKFKYKHPDYSIEPYMRLLYRDYITGTKTELDLMGKYVNKNGQRYSSNQNYENELYNLYQRINKTTRITHLQGQMRRYKTISGIE